MVTARGGSVLHRGVNNSAFCLQYFSFLKSLLGYYMVVLKPEKSTLVYLITVMQGISDMVIT